MPISIWFCLIVYLLTWAVHPPAGHTSPTSEARVLTQSILHTLDYLAVDYPHTVHNGQVIDAAEYDEQREFVHRLQTLIEQLPEHDRKAFLKEQTAALVAAIEQRLPGDRGDPCRSTIH